MHNDREKLTNNVNFVNHLMLFYNIAYHIKIKTIITMSPSKIVLKRTRILSVLRGRNIKKFTLKDITSIIFFFNFKFVDVLL